MESSFVQPFAEGLAQTAHLPGGSHGLAVIAIAVVVRLTLLPLTLRLAEQGWHRQPALQALKRQRDALRATHAKDPMAHARAAQALQKEHGITSGLGRGLLVAAVRAPLGLGIYAAIR